MHMPILSSLYCYIRNAELPLPCSVWIEQCRYRCIMEVLYTQDVLNPQNRLHIWDRSFLRLYWPFSKCSILVSLSFLYLVLRVQLYLPPKQISTAC